MYCAKQFITMKKILFALFVVCLFVACSSEPKQAELSKQESEAVDEQIKKDQEAMDSLEKVIMQQINADTLPN